MNILIFTILGALLWAILYSHKGFIIGAFIGYLFAVITELKDKIAFLEKTLQNIEIKSQEKREIKKQELVLKQEPILKEPEKKISKQKPKEEIVQEEVVYEDSFKFFNIIKKFFTEGNVVAKVGLVVLFFGLGFLVKYAAAHSLLPVEFRFIAISILGISMLITGWRLRLKNRNYALILQGGAIGILYITVFAAAKLYHLIPLSFTFFVMVALAVFSSILAVLQNASITAAFGAAGGFLAPVLTSSGSGSHVTLFSYYAILNAAIFGISWYKAWRPLNLLGFVFTLGIGSIWGFKYYQKAYFSTTEPFLIMFFIFYVVISILFALRQPPNLKGYVDGTLVFGLPVAFFTLQNGIVHEIQYGLAASALTLSAFYIILATFLWNLKIKTLNMIVEAFLALGVVFGSLAIPLALDGRWTSASWAMEGAALVWIGVRQQRLHSRLFGLLLQFGAGIAFIISLNRPFGLIPVLNGICLGAIVISFSGFFSSYYIQLNLKKLREWEELFHIVFLVWGFFWHLFAGFNEIDRFVPLSYRMNCYVLFIGFSALIFFIIYQKLNWGALRYLLSMYLPGLVLFCLKEYEDRHLQIHPLNYMGYIAWPVSIAIFYHNLFMLEEKWSESICRFQHCTSLWLITFLLTWELSWISGFLVKGAGTWSFIMWGIIPSAIVWFILTKAENIKFPFQNNIYDYQFYGLNPIIVFISLWCLYGSVSNAGNPWPISYFPLINPLEAAQLFVFVTLFLWFNKFPKNYFIYSYCIMLFISLNSVLARLVHYWGQVPFIWHHLFSSMRYHAALSVFWSFFAMALMTVASLKKNRKVWFTGAGLITAIVIKLFLIDLSGSGTIFRIISFMGVGGFMLIVGYLSPLPPKKI